ncbi:MAG: TlpA family protein disulfide reductase [Saprospiraceae bacterium]|nr:TlpA family protein disulfide reductase [Saprospiraceae bacterium]
MKKNWLGVSAAFAIILFSIFAAQCQTRTGIRGKIEMAPGWKSVLYLIEPVNFSDISASYSGRLVDSTIILPDGSFVFQLPESGQIKLYQLCIQKTGSRFFNKLEDTPEERNFFPIVMQPGTPIQFYSKADQFLSQARIEQPSPDHRALMQLRDVWMAAQTNFQETVRNIDDADENAILAHETALERYRASLMAFADTTQSFYAALVAIRWVSPENDYERIPEFLASQCRRWQAIYPGEPYTLHLCQMAHPAQLPVMVGDVMPNVELPMMDGKTDSLYHLLGPKLTLIDLWASWCAPCRKENREVLVPLYQETKDKGFQIVGYALDSNEKGWKAAIAKDQALWPQSSHLQGDVSPFLDLLRIRTIPANFLLDSQGRVVAKNLHGEELSALVRAYLEK